MVYPTQKPASNGRSYRKTPYKKKATKRSYSSRNGSARIAASGAEKKFFDISVISLNTVTTWAGGELDDATALSLSAIPQGVEQSQRIGRTAHVMSINIRGFVDYNSLEQQTAPVTQRFVRLVLVQDMQTNQAQLNAEDVMLPVASNAEQLSFRNLQFVDRFKVLGDQTIYFPMNSQMNEGAVNSFALGGELIPFSFAYKFSGAGMKQIFDDTGATVADMTTNSLHLIGASNSIGVEVNYNSRIRYFG